MQLRGEAIEQELVCLRQQAWYWQVQHARAVEREVHLIAKIKELECRVKELSAQVEEVEALKARIRKLSQQLFGHKSERVVKSEGKDQGSVEEQGTEGGEEAEAGSSRKRGKQPGQPGYGRRRRTQLPKKDIFCELPESQQRCPRCGKPFESFDGTEDSEEIEWEVRIYRKAYKRARYKPTCECGAVPGIVRAPMAPKVIPKGIFTVGFWARLIIEKYYQQNSNLKIAYCWSHVRRDFDRIIKGYPKLRAWGESWVKRIGKRYKLNDERLKVPEGTEEFGVRDHALRDDLDRMAHQRDEELSKTNLHPAKRKALKSMAEHWSGLMIFVDHPEIPMDNNAAERGLRNPVVGRKNYYGNGSTWGGRLCAILFTIIQTALLHNLNPRLFLESYFEVCAENGGRVPKDIYGFLPWNLLDEQREVWQLKRGKPP